jgi:type IV secretory pathway VirB4 component
MIRSLNSGKRPFNHHVGGASYAYLTNDTASGLVIEVHESRVSRSIDSAHSLLTSDSSKDDVIIAVVGVTGAGKSTFIEKCCGDTINIAGHNLVSCESQTLQETPGLQTNSYSHSGM